MLQDRYSKGDIMKMIANICLGDTFTEKQIADFIEFVRLFYEMGQAMGMSAFICKASLHELVDQACSD